MQISIRGSSSQNGAIDLTTNSEEGIAGLNDYLLKSTEQLAAVSELVCRGEAIDRDSHDWILAQVDFLVEAMSNDGLKFEDEMRSNALQLLLAFANLNEKIRQQTSL